MEKKIYSRPIMAVETFTPNFYCAGCQDHLIYDMTPINGAHVEAVQDFEHDWLWNSLQEGRNGNHKKIQPHGKTVYFTPEAYNKIQSIIDDCQLFYYIGNGITESNASKGYGISIPSSVMNRAESGRIEDAVTANEITGAWTSGGGQGIFAFDFNSRWEKNQS